jgi:hypothetical protein
MTPWDIKRIHTLALLQQANITLWDGWRVCDPLGDSPALSAVREFAKTFHIERLDYRSGLWGKPKPNLSMAMPSPTLPVSEMQEFIEMMIENTCKDGEVCVYFSTGGSQILTWCRSEKGPGMPDIFTFPFALPRWFVFGRGRGTNTKTLDLRGIV